MKQVKKIVLEQFSFYVDAVDGDRIVLLAGPFQSLEEAEKFIEPVRELAMSFGDPKAFWYSYGCSKWKAEVAKQGKFNKELGLLT